ncbi:MAG: alanyl-tRNA editing protein [Clostridia bacterium]|nr:alanyl-tRNA editing protein [Clostridia bacterium]
MEYNRDINFSEVAMTERSKTATVRLYEADSHLFSFTATVLSCEKRERGYAVILDQTAFFPTGGGQPFDGGTLDGQEILDVTIEGDTLLHTVKEPIPVGASVEGILDAKERLRRMASHTGEHLLSAVLFRSHSLHNVGFHLGKDDVTCDFDGVLDETTLAAAEEEVNRLIRENHPVTTSYPAPEVLKTLDYRSKLDLTENVRIVSVGKGGEIDRCACCAPHVKATGEIGILRIVFRENWKGGMRLHILCGEDALTRIRKEAACVSSLSALLSAKPEGEAVRQAVLRLTEENRSLKTSLDTLNDALSAVIVSSLSSADRPVCLFDTRDDAVALRKLATLAHNKTGGTVAVFGGSDAEGYKVVLCGKEGMRALLARLTEHLPIRGGGSDSLVCGSVKATEGEIRAAWEV